LNFSDKSESKLAWSTLTKVRRFSDGFLLFSGESAYFWWLDKALVSGSVEEVQSLIESNVDNFQNS
jgi:hypothetical protein